MFYEITGVIFLMNHTFDGLKDLVKFIERESSYKDEYRGSILLHGFVLPDVIKMLRDESWDEDEIMSFIISSNPCLWAQCWLKNPQLPREPLRLFHYQKSMLNCQHRFKVTRCGRQVGKTMCMAIDMIWTVMTQENKRLLYVAPYQNQVKVLYEDTLMRLIQDVESIKECILKSPSHPYYQAVFTNLSEIKALTAGTRAGQKGSSVRGMSMIDKLYLDEVDYMGSESIGSIMPTIFSRSESQVWASSTPTGKRDEFYRWCTAYDSTFICPECRAMAVDGSPFHYPSFISPLYSSETDKFYKSSLTASMYEHEVLAEFGEEVEGVFRHSDIDACLDLGKTLVKNADGEMVAKSYEYSDLKMDSRNLYIMGVDWNKESTGVQLVVTEYNPNLYVVNSLPSKYFRVFARESVTAREFSERGAVARIIALCKEIPISYVYADEGYGTLQIQAIRKILSKSNIPDLANRIVPINMSSNIEIVDPITKRKIPKAVKPFMVDSASRAVEDRRVVLPVIEDDKVNLVGQMREYIVERRGPSGQPIYSGNNEDVLTAFMLSIMGFICEYNEVVKGTFTQKIVTSTNSIVSARAANNVVRRAIDDQTVKKDDRPEDRKRPGVFQELANSMGLGYDHYEPGDDSDATQRVSKLPIGGSTGRSNLGNVARESSGRKRFSGGGKHVRSKF